MTETKQVENKDELQQNTSQFPPGSRKAISAGCKCPQLDNARGKGYMGIAGVYVMSERCPLHWLDTE